MIPFHYVPNSFFLIFEKELIKEEQMFDATLLEAFLDDQALSEADDTKKEQIKEAWYLYCYKILKYGNEQWLIAMKDKQLAKQKNIFKLVSCSDDALARWTILVQKPYFIEMKRKNWEIDPATKGKKKGAHISKKEMPLYIELYDKIKSKRSNKMIKANWNKLFWAKMEQHHPDALQKPQERRVRSILPKHTIARLPGMDEDEDSSSEDAS
jgi:hypothetical protein